MGMGMGGGMMMLAQAKSVQEELKLSDDQTKKLTELSQKQREAMREMFQGGGGGDRDEMRKKMEEMNKANEKAMAEILKPDQVRRLKQISLQVTEKNFGMSALLGSPDVQAELKVTDEQKEILRGLRDDMMKMMGELRDAGGSPDEMREKMDEFRKSANQKVTKLLTDDQKAKLKEMQGEPFKGELPTPGRGGRPPGKPPVG